MVAELTHGCHRMGDKEKCRSIFQHMMHALLAFFLECRISDDSPFGKALLGHKVGDIVEVEAPIGVLKYKILTVEK